MIDKYSSCWILTTWNTLSLIKIIIKKLIIIKIYHFNNFTNGCIKNKKTTNYILRKKTLKEQNKIWI